LVVATPHIGDGQWSVAAMSRTEPSITGAQVPGIERSIGERPSNRCGNPVTGIRRIYPPEAHGALGRGADGCASCCRRFRVWRDSDRRTSKPRWRSGYCCCREEPGNGLPGRRNSPTPDGVTLRRVQARVDQPRSSRPLDVAATLSKAQLTVCLGSRSTKRQARNSDGVTKGFMNGSR
jgi:hypothetical protein